MGVVFATSSVPGKNIPSIFPFQDIAYHWLMYLIMAYFFARALRITSPQKRLSEIILLTVIFGVLYGITDELHQAFVPGRTVSGFDVFIDGVGSLLGSLIYR